jgi:hypothetical protein
MSEEKHPGGRPTKYKEEYCDVSAYLLKCKEEEKLPTICGYAIYRGSPEKTIYAWAEKEEKFRKSLDFLLTFQKEQLLNMSLKGDYNSTIAKLMLSHNHKMIEKSATEHSGQVQLGPPVIE